MNRFLPFLVLHENNQTSMSRLSIMDEPFSALPSVKGLDS